MSARPAAQYGAGTETELPEDAGGADLWAAVLPGQVMLPAYLVSPYAAHYRGRDGRTALILGLAGAGCLIRVRADFDRAGMIIFDQLRTAAPDLEPWRFDAATYSAALSTEVDLDPARHGAVHEEASSLSCSPT